MNEREMFRQLVGAIGLEVACRRERTRGKAAHRWLVDFPAVAEWMKPVSVAIDVSKKPHADDISIVAAWTEVILCFNMREQVVMSRRDSGVEVTDVTRPAVGVFHIALQACYHIIKHTGNVRW